MTGTPASYFARAIGKAFSPQNSRPQASTRSNTHSFSRVAIASALFAGAISIARSETIRRYAHAAVTRKSFCSLSIRSMVTPGWWPPRADRRYQSFRRQVGHVPQGTIRDRAAEQLIDAAGLTGQIQVRDVPTPSPSRD